VIITEDNRETPGFVPSFAVSMSQSEPYVEALTRAQNPVLSGAVDPHVKEDYLGK